MTKTLEQYLKENFEKGIIDHSFRATVTTEGRVTIYIHASGHDSDTLDYFVSDDMLVQRNINGMLSDNILECTLAEMKREGLIR